MSNQKVKNALAVVAVIGMFGLMAYLGIRSQVKTLSVGPTLTSIIGSTQTDPQADDPTDEEFQKDKAVKKFVMDMVVPVFQDFNRMFGIGLPYEENYQIRRRGPYVRIMGSAPKGKNETVAFMFVLREGKQVFVELGSYYSDGTYPQGVFERVK